MNKGKRHILVTWIILICFAAGQWCVYAHYHPTSYIKANTSKSQQTRTTISERCQLCDAMHHTSMTQENHTFFVPLITSELIYKQGQYNFVSIALILAAGRAPPIS